MSDDIALKRSEEFFAWNPYCNIYLGEIPKRDFRGKFGNNYASYDIIFGDFGRKMAKNGYFWEKLCIW